MLWGYRLFASPVLIDNRGELIADVEAPAVVEPGLELGGSIAFDDVYVELPLVRKAENVRLLLPTKLTRGVTGSALSKR